MNEAGLEARVRGLEVQMSAIQTTQTLNHEQNRSSIHELRNTLQTLVDKVTGLEIKNARWSLGAGVLTGIALKMIDHFMK